MSHIGPYADFTFTLLNAMSEQILFFAYLMGPNGANKPYLRFAIFKFSEKLQNIFEIGLEKYE